MALNWSATKLRSELKQILVSFWNKALMCCHFFMIFSTLQRTFLSSQVLRDQRKVAHNLSLFYIFFFFPSSWWDNKPNHGRPNYRHSRLLYHNPTTNKRWFVFVHVFARIKKNMWNHFQNFAYLSSSCIKYNTKRKLLFLHFLYTSSVFIKWFQCLQDLQKMNF